MFLQLILAKLHYGEYLLSAAIECEVCQKSEWKQCRNKHKKQRPRKTFHFLIIQFASLISCFIFGVFQRTLIDKQREITQLSKEGFNLSRTTVVLYRWKLLQGKKKGNLRRVSKLTFELYPLVSESDEGLTFETSALATLYNANIIKPNYLVISNK